MSFQVEIDKAIKEKRLYFIGDALPVDWYAGVKLWLAHAEAGDAKAQYNIGRCYSRGDGVDQDREQALKWYLKAAEQGDPRTYFNLYVYYGDDKERTYDSEISEAYLKKAVELKETRALSVMDKRAEAAYFQKGEKLKEEIQNLLLDKKLDDAKKLALNALEQNYPWASSLFCALSIEISKICVTTILGQNVTAGGIHQGSTVYDTTLTTDYTTKFVIKNPTSYECHIRFFKKEQPKIYYENFLKIEKSTERDYEEKGDVEPLKGESFYVVSFLDKPNDFENTFNNNIMVNGIIQFIKIPIINAPRASKLKVNNRKGCFIVTACYGDEEHSTVKEFRKFRDTVLTKYSVGRNFIKFYYEYGPAAAEFISTKEYIKKPLRVLLTLIAKVLP